MLREESKGDVVAVTLTQDSLTFDDAEAFRRAMERHLGGACDLVELDLSNLRHIDSRGLGAIVALHKMASGTRLVLCGVGAGVARLLRLTRLDRMFSIRRDAE